MGQSGNAIGRSYAATSDASWMKNGQMEKGVMKKRAVAVTALLFLTTTFVGCGDRI